MSAIDLVNDIEYQLKASRSKTFSPWPPLSGHALNIYKDCEALRLLLAPPPPPPPPSPPPPPAPTPVPVGALLFSDDFNGALDTHKWEGKHFKAPSGTQWDYLNHATVDGNSNLVITAKKVSGQWYSSFLAGLSSGGSSYKGPRYVEARVKVPSGLGTFPACPWEWASSGPGAPEAKWGNGPIEIDYMEILGKEITKLHTTVHPWLPSGDHPVGNANDVGVDLSLDFHRYGGAVYADHVDFYFDGKKIWTADMSVSGLGDLTTYPVVPCIDLDMGGWGGPVDPALTQAVMLVDYLKVWRLA